MLSTISAAVLMTYSASSKSIDLAKAKIASVALANEKMEELRNMPYDKLATEHGAIYPPGNILDEEIIEEKGIQFRVNTVISYIDDPYDGNVDGTISGKPVDIYPYDYKRAEITVTKLGRNTYLTKLSSNFSAKAAETASNSGIIKICIVDASGSPVPEADVNILNPEVTPAVNINAKTGLDGCLMVPNLPPTTQNNYHIIATKDGYSTDMTYPRTAQNPNALVPDVDVSIQQVTNQTLIIDKISRLTVDIVDKNGQPLANSPVHVVGSKEKYFNPSTPKYENDFTTDANGHLEIADIEFDDYTFSIANKFIISSSPYQPASLLPDSNLNVRLLVSDSGADISIDNCQPRSGRVGERVFLSIAGTNFDHSVAVKIVNPANNHEITAENVSVFGNVRIDAEVNLSGAEPGLWNLILTNPDETSVNQQNGFEVKI